MSQAELPVSGKPGRRQGNISTLSLDEGHLPLITDLRRTFRLGPPIRTGLLIIP